MRKATRRLCVAGIALMLTATSSAVLAQSPAWQTIVNNAELMPGTSVTFNSFNQPSVNSDGLVVFRARSKGGSASGVLTAPVPGMEVYASPSTWSTDAAATGPVHGIYLRNLPPGGTAGAIVEVTSRGKTVPQPNNVMYNGVLASFEEFPSTPRIDIMSPTIATRGQSLPVYEYQTGIDPVTQLPVTTRIGASGIYSNPGGVLMTGASLLGAVLDFPAGTPTFPWFAVPGAPAGTRFDQFPGAPAVTNGTVIAFKGNYTDPSDLLGKTGVYYRDIAANAGQSPIQLVANSMTTIPNPPGAPPVTFGSTAPPSAANGYMVFTGLDIEEAPTRGGIYRAPLAPSPALQTLAGIGDQVPGEAEGVTFNVFGEGLSLSSDARYTSFWGAWGTETFNKLLICPADGNAEVIAYCVANYPNGYSVAIPVHQGIFVADAVSGRIYPVAKTLANGYTDFLYWVFSGRPPGTGGGDEPSLEPPRWRSSAFSALYGAPGLEVQTAFKATRQGMDGIYVRRGRSMASPVVTFVETQAINGQAIDPAAPANSIVTAVGIERDGFRSGNLVVAVSMLYEDPLTSIGWAGLYRTIVPPMQPVPDANSPVFQSAVSSRVHGAAGTFNLALSAVPTNPTTEPRQGPTQTVVFTFDRPITAAVVAVSEGTATASAPTFSGSDVVVNLSGVSDRQYVTISLTGVEDSTGGTGGVASARLGFLVGDVNQNRAVTVADVGLVNAQLSQAVSAANFLLDVNVNGTLTLADKAITNANLAQALPAP